VIHESQLPPVLLEEHMAQLLDLSVSGLRKARKKRSWSFVELPRISRKPRWSRDAVLAQINGTARISPRRVA
jgi:hypothetical protein